MERNSISRKKARMRRKRNRAIMIGAVGITVAVCVTGGFLWQKKVGINRTNQTDSQESSIVTESITLPVDETQAAKVTIEGINITGLTLEEAKEKLFKEYAGVLEVKAGEEVVTLENPVEAELERLLAQVYSQPGIDQTLDFDDQRIQQRINDQVASLAAKWDKSPVNSALVSFDKATGSYEYSKEQSGQKLAQERLAETLLSRVEAGDYSTPVEAVFSETAPDRTQAQTKELYRVLGTFTTKLTSNKNRNQNVKLAAEAIEGKILQPGEEFSFNGTTGNRTSEKGYQPAGAYRNGILIEEPGGGVCQVSTTLYHSIIQSGFKTTERNSHSFAPSYVEKGQDAMVSFDGYAGPDLKFKNTSDAPIVLRASMQGLELKLSIVGIPLLEDGMKVSIRSEKIRDVEPPAPVYEEDTTLPYGTEKIVDQAQSGSVWKSYRVYTKNGAVVKEEQLHNSTYKTKTALIKRNTTVMAEPTSAEVPTGTADPNQAANAAGTGTAGTGTTGAGTGTTGAGAGTTGAGTGTAGTGTTGAGAGTAGTGTTGAGAETAGTGTTGAGTETSGAQESLPTQPVQESETLVIPQNPEN